MQDDLQTMANSDGVSIHSGFPNPALDRRGQGPRLALDIDQLLVRNPSSTYLFRIAGHRWSDQGIYDGDIAVIDRSVQRRPTDLVVIWQDTSFGLCRHRQLRSGEEAWGVVTATIHQFTHPVEGK
ncbi:MAG TPA: S24 family peptidase [Verrucomicrobiae bacterium]|jgi:DNA polymerase V|nr:S24 family peptidase [Verrucomicrobiae bacterium]